jgi:cysteine-rich repeat protein
MPPPAARNRPCHRSPGQQAHRDTRRAACWWPASNGEDHITAGGNFAGARRLPAACWRAQLEPTTDDRILIAAQSSGRVVDITAGGNFGADPGFAFGLSGPVDLVQDAAGQIFVSEASASQVTNITAGGNFTGLPAFAFGRQFAGLTIDGSGRLLANLLVGTSAYDITAGAISAPRRPGRSTCRSPRRLSIPCRRSCGDSMLDPMEQCDDGNAVGGDCCSATCQLEAVNAPCPDDGQTCTVDRCNGTGTCLHPAGNVGALCRPAGGTCDLAETCNGVSSSCPSDALQPSGTARSVKRRHLRPDRCAPAASARPMPCSPAGERRAAAAGAFGVRARVLGAARAGRGRKLRGAGGGRRSVR